MTRLSAFHLLCLLSFCALLIPIEPVHGATHALHRRALPNGARCSASTQCDSGNCNRARCADKQRNGHACYKDAGCLSGACFNDHTCYTPGQGTLGNGSKCSTSASCASDNCSRAECHDKQPNGASCYKAANCLSNNCVSGACSAAPPPVTSTTTTSTTMTTTTTSTTTTPPASTPTIVCSAIPQGAGLSVFNTANNVNQSNPYETFGGSTNTLHAVPSTASHILVNIFRCSSSYMGYPTGSGVPDDTATYYGQIRIPSLSNDCLTATNPGAEATFFTHQACSTLDNASQLGQFFGFYAVNRPSESFDVQYLGATYASSKNVRGKVYGTLVFQPNNNQALQLVPASHETINNGIFLGNVVVTVISD